MSSTETPVPKRRYYFNLSEISPPTKRSSLGKGNVTYRSRRQSPVQIEQRFPQQVVDQLLNLTPLEQKPPLLENSTVGEFQLFKPLFQDYKSKNGTKPLSELISLKAKNFLCTLIREIYI